MKRILTTILSLGLVAVMPTLCAAGLITHACECGSVSGCHHESGCADDPCSSNMVTGRTESKVLDSALALMAAAPCGDLLSDDASCRPSVNLDVGAPPGAGCPLHASDVPFLI